MRGLTCDDVAVDDCFEDTGGSTTGGGDLEIPGDTSGDGKINLAEIWAIGRSIDNYSAEDLTLIRNNIDLWA